MFSSPVLSCRMFGEEGNVLRFCPVERSVRRSMFSTAVMWIVL